MILVPLSTYFLLDDFFLCNSYIFLKWNSFVAFISMWETYMKVNELWYCAKSFFPSLLFLIFAGIWPRCKNPARCEKSPKNPQLVWLSGLSTCLRAEGSPVRFPVRAHTWGAGQSPSRGHATGHTVRFLSLSPSLLLSENKFFKKN